MKLDEKFDKDSDLPCEVAGTQRIHGGGGGVQGVGRSNRANFKTTVPSSCLFHAATVGDPRTHTVHHCGADRGSLANL
jgi:hypothetical protein